MDRIPHRPLLASSLILLLCSCSTPSINDPQPVTETATETKVGVIDLMEVLNRSNIGQPALARWNRDVEELTRREPWYLAPHNRRKAFITTLASIMPKVETVTQTLAEKHDLAVVLQKGTSETAMITLYYADMIDLTNQVIEELNRRFP